MIRQSDILADLHIHTVMSLHAYSTLKECIDEAAGSGMRYIAITDHYYNDGTELNRDNEVNRLIYMEGRANRTRAPLKVIGGVEFNIAQPVKDWDRLQRVKWKLMGVHGWFLDGEAATLDMLFRHFADAAERCDAFAHIERELHRIDHCKHGSILTDEVKEFLKKIVWLARDKNIVLELNESSLGSNDSGAVDRIKYWLMAAKENGNILSLGTDAHYCEEIGKFDKAIEILNEVGFPRERILNCDECRMERLALGEKWVD